MVPAPDEIPGVNMKLFKFDPKTGFRGDLIDHVKRASWTDAYWREYDGAKPIGFGRGAEARVHHDAGIGFGDDEVSYRHPTEWVCFCLGCWRVGVHDDGTPDEHWEWIILPPTGYETR
jgi:hypothetical protein